mmetsp:Transcript_20219/g.48875  ORF Transcript_20219/g.48875 Transcript_20219/m.48875 type:complete len:206 (+) Transcript_20219:328-945(+)
MLNTTMPGSSSSASSRADLPFVPECLPGSAWRRPLAPRAFPRTLLSSGIPSPRTPWVSGVTSTSRPARRSFSPMELWRSQSRTGGRTERSPSPTASASSSHQTPRPTRRQQRLTCMSDTTPTLTRSRASRTSASTCSFSGRRSTRMRGHWTVSSRRTAGRTTRSPPTRTLPTSSPSTRTLWSRRWTSFRRSSSRRSSRPRASSAS